MLDRADVLRQTPWPQLTGSGPMVLARWILALGLAVGAATLIAKWIQRKWPGIVLPTEARIEG